MKTLCVIGLVFAAVAIAGYLIALAVGKSCEELIEYEHECDTHSFPDLTNHTDGDK